MGCEAEILTESAVRSILDELDKSFTFDSRDVSKPSSDEMLRKSIRKFAPDCQRRLEDEFFGYGPLKTLLSDFEVKEIVVNGAQDIWFERNGQFQKLPDQFHDALTFRNFIDRLCAEAEIKVDLSQPFADGRWLEFRVHLGCAPLTQCDFHLTLRRLNEKSWTLNELFEKGWANPDQMSTLRRLIDEHRNILFVGPTGCGKTTALSACLRELPESERVVIIEDTDELPRPNSASSKLLTRPPIESSSLPAITLTDLVRHSLRMRPFRITMGEVRGGEAKDLLMAMATGHSGSFATIHAAEPRQALLRLEMLVQLGAPQWDVQAIRQLILLSIEYIVVCGFDGGKRRLGGIHKVAALESFGFLLETIA